MGVNRRILPGVGEADVYDNLRDVPYNLLGQGGTFYCLNVPGDMQGVGLGMGAQSIEQSTIGGGSAGPAYLGPGEMPDPNAHWLVTLLIKYSALIIGTICAVVVVQQLTNFVYTIKAVPQGEVNHEFEDGSILWTSGDGSTWRLWDDGRSEQLTGPTDITSKLLVAGIVIVAVIVSIIVLFQFGPSIGKKVKEKMPKAKPKPS